MTPAWDIHIGGFLLPGLFWPAAVLPGIVAGFLFVWPWLDGLVMRDDDLHNVLQTPRDRPGRTAIGAGLLTFLVHAPAGRRRRRVRGRLPLDLPTLLAVMQGLTIGLPFVVGLLVYAVFRHRHLAVAERGDAMSWVAEPDRAPALRPRGCAAWRARRLARDLARVGQAAGSSRCSPSPCWWRPCWPDPTSPALTRRRRGLGGAHGRRAPPR